MKAVETREVGNYETRYSQNDNYLIKRTNIWQEVLGNMYISSMQQRKVPNSLKSYSAIAFKKGSGYFAVDGNLLLESILS